MYIKTPRDFAKDKIPDLEYLKRMCKYLESVGELYFIQVLENGGIYLYGDVTVKPENPPIAIWQEKYRGIGIGFKVMQTVIRRLSALGYEKITGTSIFKWNIASQKMHERLGFGRVGETDNEYIYEYVLTGQSYGGFTTRVKLYQIPSVGNTVQAVCLTEGKQMQCKVEICGVITSKLRVIKNDEMMELIHRTKQGDMAAREQLIEGNLRLVLSVIQKFMGRGENPDDLFQVGCVGLLKAIANLMSLKRAVFYLWRTDDCGEIRRYLRDNSASCLHGRYGIRLTGCFSAKSRLCVRPSASQRWRRSPRRWSFRRRRSPTPWTPIATPVSLFEPVYSDGGDPLTVMDQVRDERNTDEQWTEHIALREAMARLSEREKQILALRFYDGKTQMEVANPVGISQAPGLEAGKGRYRAAAKADPNWIARRLCFAETGARDHAGIGSWQAQSIPTAYRTDPVLRPQGAMAGLRGLFCRLKAYTDAKGGAAMQCRITDLRCKEVIDLCTRRSHWLCRGRGADPPWGADCGPGWCRGRGKCFGLFGREEMWLFPGIACGVSARTSSW